MSYDKHAKTKRLHNDVRVQVNQKKIWEAYKYSPSDMLTVQRLGSFRKGKAMNCSCRICRQYAEYAKVSKYKFQLERQTMREEYDGI